MLVVVMVVTRACLSAHAIPWAARQHYRVAWAGRHALVGLPSAVERPRHIQDSQARFWSWLSGKSPPNLASSSLLARKWGRDPRPLPLHPPTLHPAPCTLHPCTLAPYSYTPRSLRACQTQNTGVQACDAIPSGASGMCFAQLKKILSGVHSIAWKPHQGPLELNSSPPLSPQKS